MYCIVYTRLDALGLPDTAHMVDAEYEYRSFILNFKKMPPVILGLRSVEYLLTALTSGVLLVTYSPVQSIMRVVIIASWMSSSRRTRLRLSWMVYTFMWGVCVIYSTSSLKPACPSLRHLLPIYAYPSGTQRAVNSDLLGLMHILEWITSRMLIQVGQH